MKFEEQSFVIVGATRPDGIGLTFVNQLLTIGVKKIAVFDVVSSDAFNELQEHFSDRTVLFYKVDIRNKAEIEESFKEVVNKFGYVDVLVNFAAIFNDSKVEDTLLINLLGRIYCTSIGIDNMSLKNGGRGGMIVNLASVAALDPYHRAPVYSASKAAVVSYTRALANKEFAPEFGIKFVIICPAATVTNLFRDGVKDLIGNFDPDAEFYRIAAEYGGQTPDECAKSLIQALKESKNGSTWILNKGKYEPVRFHQYFFD